MVVLVIDGQGGGIGKNLVEQLRVRLPDVYIIAAGTNALATAAMLRAGANIGATGENAIVYNCRGADIIVGPMGIVLADAMLGELTPAMACAVGQSRAQRVLIPVNRCQTVIAGLEVKTASRYIEDAVEAVAAIVRERAAQ
jgi:hypothetical protein